MPKGQRLQQLGLIGPPQPLLHPFKPHARTHAHSRTHTLSCRGHRPLPDPHPDKRYPALTPTYLHVVCLAMQTHTHTHNQPCLDCTSSDTSQRLLQRRASPLTHLHLFNGPLSFLLLLLLLSGLQLTSFGTVYFVLPHSVSWNFSSPSLALEN